MIDSMIPANWATPPATETLVELSSLWPDWVLLMVPPCAEMVDRIGRLRRNAMTVQATRRRATHPKPATSGGTTRRSGGHERRAPRGRRGECRRSTLLGWSRRGEPWACACCAELAPKD